QLITNKLEPKEGKEQEGYDYSKSVVGLYGGIDKQEIVAYLKNEDIKIKKILVTYDSLPALINIIEGVGYVTKDFNIHVDEYDSLLDYYDFRYDAIRKVLDNYSRFNEFCFMSATPLHKDLTLIELDHLPLVKCRWLEMTMVGIKHLKLKAGVK